MTDSTHNDSPASPDGFAAICEREGISPETAALLLDAAKLSDTGNKFAKESQKWRQRVRALEAEVAALKQPARPAADADPDELATLRHEARLNAALDSVDFAPGGRVKIARELRAGSYLDDAGKLMLKGDDPAEDAPLNEEVLREIVPPEALASRAGGGSGSRQPPEARAGLPNDRVVDDTSAALTSQKAYERLARERGAQKVQAEAMKGSR